MKKMKVKLKIATGEDNTPKRRCFYDRYPKQESRRLTKVLAIQYAMQAGPYSPLLLNCIRKNDVEGLLSFDYNYGDFTLLTVRQLAALRQCLALYSKDDELTLAGVNKENNCLSSLVKTELKCRDTNIRLSLILRREAQCFTRYPVFYRVAEKISQILKKAPDVRDLGFSFGPGSTTNVSKRNASPLNKLNAELECSPKLIGSALGREYLLQWHHLVTEHGYVQGCLARLGMVPKNALTYRTTVTEPSINMPAQLELGKRIRKALLDYGLDLKNGQKHNQELALLGSVTDEEATVDIENASNTIAIFAVYLALYLSKDWFELLDAFRSPSIKFDDGESHCLEMFSSMGNGFTFELETLIFYAIALVTCEDLGLSCKNVSVYGDDIIVPAEAYTNLVETLNLYGFKVNDTKSFASGPFRESCGKDYFLGTNIRPFYKKDQWTDARLVRLLNHDSEHFSLLSRSFRSWLIKNMKSEIYFGPSGFGDGHIVAVYYAEQASIKYRRVHRTTKQRFKHGDKPGYIFTTYSKQPASQLPKKLTKEQREKLTEHSNNLFPLYDIFNKPKHRFIYSKHSYFALSDAVVLAEDGVFVNCYERKRLETIVQPDYTEQDTSCEALEADPYVLPGGWREKKTDIYILNLPALQVTFEFDPIFGL